MKVAMSASVGVPAIAFSIEPAHVTGRERSLRMPVDPHFDVLEQLRGGVSAKKLVTD